MNVDDTDTWLPLDGLQPGFDANKAPHTGDLAGRDLVIAFDDGNRVRYRFAAADRLEWEVLAGDSSSSGGADDCEPFEVAPGLYYVQFQHTRAPRTATSLYLDLTAGRALAVVTRIGDPDGHGPACTQDFPVGTIEGTEPSGAAPHPSLDLIGRRAMWVYSEAHAYEHVYLSPHWYTWQCLAGPERGLADTDACTTYQLRPGVYVFAWREKVVPCAAVTVADHTRMSSHGVLFGLDEAGTGTVHFTFGAVGRLLSVTVHPDRYDPRSIEA